MVKAYTSAIQTRWQLRGLKRFLFGGCVFLGAGLASAVGAPPVAKMLEYTPRHESNVSTPTKAEHASCTVELLKNKTGGSGWVLKDPQGRTLRRFFSSDGRNVDLYSYYKDGVEVYREIVGPGSRTPDNFRWLNAGGSRWGIDEDRNGTIDSWKMISAEEVSQEVLRALATRDLRRLEALLINDDDIRALGMPAEMADGLQARRKGVKEKFEATIGKLTKLSEKAKWLHLETGAPQCVPADDAGTKADLIRYPRATVLFESGGANEWFQIGPMIRVGAAWKIIDAPTAGTAIEESGPGGQRTMDIGQNPKLQKAIEKLSVHDKKSIPQGGEEAVKHHLNRADVLEEIVALVKPGERDPWIRQVADSLSSAVQVAGAKGDKTPGTRLASLEKQLLDHVAGSNLAAYVSYRRMQAEYSNKLGDGKANFNEIQKDWLEKLTAFVKAYPRAEDTPDAMLQLGIVSEFLGKEVEAKNYFTALIKTFPDTPQGAKGAGAVRRLELEGKPMRVAGPLLSDPGTTFDLESIKDKVVVVYYWASWNGQAANDFAKLKSIVEGSGKQVELVGINLDANVEDAKAFLTKNPVPGTHLHQTGGLESKLATAYGVFVLPSVFVVGKDGKCVSKAGQVNTLEEEIKKIVKK